MTEPRFRLMHDPQQRLQPRHGHSVHGRRIDHDADLLIQFGLPVDAGEVPPHAGPPCLVPVPIAMLPVPRCLNCKRISRRVECEHARIKPVELLNFDAAGMCHRYDLTSGECAEHVAVRRLVGTAPSRRR